MFPKPAPRMKEPRRFSSLPKKRATQRRSDRRRNPGYMAKVRTLPCLLVKEHTCEGRIEVDHLGPRPLGRKCHDDETGPMCHLAHYLRTNYLGYFAGFTAVEMREWCDEGIAITRARLGWVPLKREG